MAGPRKSKKLALREESALYKENGAGAHFRFIDLFCGIGGFRFAFERAGAECVFSSDWDKHSKMTYKANFDEEPAGDINLVNIEEEIKEFDILCAGFPCQPFSLAGVSKKNSLGRKHGFECEKQGNLFFRIADILKRRQPAAFVLENVKNLKGHDNGKTWKTIESVLTDPEDVNGYGLRYNIFPEIIDARCVVPQHRERIFIVGFRKHKNFEFPRFPKDGPRLREILEPSVPEKYTLSDHLWRYLRDYAEKHRAAGNGFGFGLFGGNDVARTLSARYHKDGSEILIDQGPRKNPRRLTPVECARLMGYEKKFIGRDFIIPSGVSDTQAYRQFGNSVVVPVVSRIAEKVIRVLSRPSEERETLVLEVQKEDDAEVSLRASRPIRYHLARKR